MSIRRRAFLKALSRLAYLPTLLAYSLVPERIDAEPTSGQRRGLALTIGINNVDPMHYGDGTVDSLAACEFDAQDIADIAKYNKFETTTWLTKDATSDKLLAFLKDAAARLKTGDFLLIFYSGHGGQVIDPNAADINIYDQTWCMYDRQVVDKELYVAWSKFAEGVRILVISDSCHSGSVTKELKYEMLAQLDPAQPAVPGMADRLAQFRLDAGGAPPKERVKYKALAFTAAAQVYHKNKAVYESILKSLPDTTKLSVQAAVLLLSACQDNQLASDGLQNSAFTGMLKRMYGDIGKPSTLFKGDYGQLHDRIISNMPPEQSPNYFTVGGCTRSFEDQQPFVI